MVNPGAFPLAAGAQLALTVGAGEEVYASSALGTTIQVLATSGRGI